MSVLQAIQNEIDSIDQKLGEIADLGDQIVKLRTQQSTMAKHNAEMLAKLKVMYCSWRQSRDDLCSHSCHICFLCAAGIAAVQVAFKCA